MVDSFNSPDRNGTNNQATNDDNYISAEFFFRLFAHWTDAMT